MPESLNYKGWIFRVDRKSNYRPIKLSISPNGTLSILTAKSLTRKEVFNFIEQHESWCRKKLANVHSKIEKHPLRLGLEGEEVLFLGLKRRIVYKKSFEPKVSVFGGQLILENSQFSSKQNLRMIRQYYKKEAEKIFTELVEIRTQEMKVNPTKIIFRNQSSRWGSCSFEGTISLNWKLSMAPLKTMDYVVVHELAHLKFRNHSREFWNFVAQYAPDFKVHGSWLKKNHYEFDWLSNYSQLHCSEIKHIENNALRPQKRMWNL